MELILKLFFNADSIPSVKWLRASISFVLFKFTTVNTLISASTLPLLWKIQNNCSVIELFDHQLKETILFTFGEHKRGSQRWSFATFTSMHKVSLAKSGFQGPEVTVITRFSARLSCYPCYNKPEGNTLAATEFIRLLDASGSITAKQSNGTRENTLILGSSITRM